MSHAEHKHTRSIETQPARQDEVSALPLKHSCSSPGRACTERPQGSLAVQGRRRPHRAACRRGLRRGSQPSLRTGPQLSCQGSPCSLPLQVPCIRAAISMLTQQVLGCCRLAAVSVLMQTPAQQPGNPL